MKTIRMAEMTWPDIKAAIESGFTTVVVGVGATERHGPHLPTMTDARIGDELAHRVARHREQERTSWPRLLDLWLTADVFEIAMLSW